MMHAPIFVTLGLNEILSLQMPNIVPGLEQRLSSVSERHALLILSIIQCVCDNGYVALQISLHLELGLNKYKGFKNMCMSRDETLCKPLIGKNAN